MVATFISNASDDAVRTFLHTELYSDASLSSVIPAGTLLSIAGENGSQNGSELAVGWKRTGSSDFEISVLKPLYSVNDNQDNPRDIIHTTFRSGGIYPVFNTVQYGLEIAINYGKVGITSVYNGTLYFREASFSSPSVSNHVIVPGSLTWIGNLSTVTGSFTTQNYSPSIIAYGNAFRVGWSALYFTSETPHVVLWRDIGSNSTNSTIKYLYLHTYGYNDFDGVQLSRLNASSTPQNPGTFAFVARHNDGFYQQNRLATVVITNESIPYQVSYSYNLLANVENCSVSTYSTSSSVSGVYKTSNQSLYKLNEIATPNYPHKESNKQANAFSAAVVNYNKGNQSFEQFYVQSANQDKNVVPISVETDSLGQLWLSDWFTCNHFIELNAYSSDSGNLPFTLALVNEKGVIVSEVRAKGEKMKSISEVKSEDLLSSFKTIVAFAEGSGERVRIQVLPKLDQSEVTLSQWFMPTEQEKLSADAVADISDWTQTEIPSEFGVNAYPNPFNPTTTVQLNLPMTSTITVQIFDVTGRLVSELFKGEKQAGVHEFGFNASKWSSGTYFIRMQYQQANGSAQMTTKAITILK